MISNSTDTNTSFEHKSVLLEESIDGLNINSNGVYVDGTVGLGGHSEKIVQKLTGGRLFCFDLDKAAISIASDRLSIYGDKIVFINDDYKNMIKYLEKDKVSEIDGIILDLGMSSMQIDDASRGFSYMNNGYLDMRMDKESQLTAFEVVNNYSYEDLVTLFKEYGEEINANRIAHEILKRRAVKKIETTTELADIICSSYPMREKRKGHPAKKVFQAIRIEVNNELRGLYEFICAALLRLKVGGRGVFITFHSLEDRIVKQAIQYLEKDCVCDKKAPICTCNKRSEVKIINKKPIVASIEEIKKNSRAQSAKLRIVERI
ncbi:MAG TPA: 16S rRNA (cytosine(1402)-N(4))-methyltransferase RsmH [Clostridia bacterium]|jgi:16S rRNA (cytosine1402-N4)-methyltransferase|nr:16S rRNA (cytosine(1402)-N(4))-methyltransferase RsmH [Clostridia bacterium]